ncbi:putative ATPase [Bradyrhizobium japonicum]|uniref:AAA family ATPase n=1 Tax=Bradyrhizobium japonicum TaxID=375 RepID=UPI00216A59D2|nr:ATP-binding protein [Bradyrhizobium japonicum]MCS3495890.1 putative ATPase [Bradyrhizobium japonicum]MCS3961948.1 putative ATPase [Bradyrhizobium japonicum]MCS3994265.1 putative ATPase [Bradyrhizobium japonicum]
MHIKRFEVVGLPKADSPSIAENLNSDLNIFTGRNGSGKTTLLKLLWYVISGNIEHAAREVPFSSVYVETDVYSIRIKKRDTEIEEVEFVENDELEVIDAYYDEDGDAVNDPASEANAKVMGIGSSVFFPTFRRIEGGFSIRPSNRRLGFTSNRPSNATRSQMALEESLVELSRRMTVESHTFVASLSTIDIVDLLMKRYTEMSEQSNTLQQQTSQAIIDRIRQYKKESGAHTVSENPDAVIDKIRAEIEGLDQKRAQILAPLDAVRSLVERLFQHTGIVLNSRLSFGDAATAVNSEALSAGEKQMLSFICYNAFYRNSVIFIDEPELSLHVDWQRQLFPILQSQGTSNQFIIATHSPFIYGKFPEKEIAMNIDRGESVAGVSGNA